MGKEKRTASSESIKSVRKAFKGKGQGHHFAGSASKGQGFTLQRKMKTLRKYPHKAQNSIIKKEVQDGIGELRFDNLEKTRKTYEDKKAATLARKKEREEARGIHEKTIRKNIKQRKNIAKDLSKKTKKGQPIMANQMSYLLEKIKKNT